MYNSLQNFFSSAFVRSVAIVGMGGVGAQAIALLFSPILTRMFGPDEMGALSLFISLTALGGQIGTLSYHNAVPLAKSDGEMLALVKLCKRGAQFFSLLCVLILFFAFFFQGEFSGFSGRLQDYWALPVAIYIIAECNASNALLIVKGAFRASSIATVLQALFNGFFSVLAGLALGSAQALILANVLSHVGRYYFLRKAKDGVCSALALDVEVTSLRGVAQKHKGFLLYRAPQEIINAVAANVPILILGYQYGFEIVGYYGLAMRVLAVPSTVIGQAIGPVFYPKVSKAIFEKRQATRLISTLTIALGVVGALPYGLIFFFGESIFEFVFGPFWGLGGEYARWLALWCWFGLMNVAAVRAIPALNLHKQFLLAEVVGLLLRILVLLSGHTLGLTAVHIVAFLSGIGCLFNFYLIVLVLVCSRKAE